ncbi:hypothetical protein N7447_004795 [Penicillium robsamsonii]|uniref:uncharacterized protein n=1 Tax=Penicillium robsamsonii TaxID=1792511 RepID=UPI002546D57B|nr:uncharacterized protein N7447_004795 [Penicillium robsamsonii]KAJ5822455.1 hypothetical protein N7447_004795 [Penicillium robsamsonii]
MSSANLEGSRPSLKYSAGLPNPMADAVFLAWHRNNKVALVNIHPLKQQFSSVKLLLETMSQFSHPSFLDLLGCYCWEDQVFLVWESVELSVSNILASRCTITEGEVVAIVRPVLEGIQYLRGRGRAFAALSADTMLLTESGGVRIGEWGTCLLTVVNVVAGVEYSCQINAAEMDAATLKLFALAGVVKRLIMKNPPHYPWHAEAKGLPEELKSCSSQDELYADISRGIHGATVGVDRILSFLDRHHIKATWFVPAHSLQSFLSQVVKIRDGGHEIGAHGYTHEHMSALNSIQEEEVLSQSLQILTSFLGKQPKGWTAPAWKPSPHTVPLLEKYGFEYDHSLMHHDSQMYHLPYSPSTWMQPMGALHASSIVEIPANWHLDDWLAFNVGNGGNGFVDPNLILRLWTEQFDFYYKEYDSFVFPMTIHPQVGGSPRYCACTRGLFIRKCHGSVNGS